MTQVLPRYCPRCGAPIVTSSGACAACGLPLEAMLSRERYKPSEQAFHTQKSLPEIDQEVTQHDLYVQQDNQLDTVPTLQLGQQRNSVSGTQSFEEQVEQHFDVTILNVQQSQSFVKDPNTSTNGMVRLNLQERNLTDAKVVWSYATVAHLIVKGKSLVSPTYVNSVVSVTPGASQTSVVDFAVPSNYSVNQLTLVLGATNEAQMLIPANLSKYRPKTINLNGQMQYFGLNWTLTRATSSLSIQDQQAAKGKRFITLMLKVDNTLSQVAITGSSYEYMRLQYGNATALPKHSTIPVAFNVGAVGITGTVSFQVPQNTTSFTLVLEPQKGDSGDQGSTDFQMP